MVPAVLVAGLFLLRTAPALSIAGCSCDEPGVSLQLVDEVASRVVDVRASGAGCRGVTIVCRESTDAGCTSYLVPSAAEGTCHVEVEFDDGETFRSDVRFVDVSGCQCDGLYPESGDPIEVTRG
jgi:hypothetical protein